MKHLAVLTSGGDAPGMNAAIRAVVRAAVHNGIKISAVHRGYQGLVDAADGKSDQPTVEEFGPRSVANIIQHGGTILRTARCLEFYEPEGRARAASALKARGIEGLIVIGGDGSFRGASLLHEEHGFQCVGVPATIDNDIGGTDETIGFNTAINIALEAVDRLRDTAASHDRLFLVEVMGRNAGHIALHVGLAGGAEAICVPEPAHALTAGAVYEMVQKAHRRGKCSSIILVAEGAFGGGGAMALQRELQRRTVEYEVRTSILAHIQRGGSPTTADRVLASLLGRVAVDKILAGETGVMVGRSRGETVTVPLQRVFGEKRKLNSELLRTARVLAV